MKILVSGSLAFDKIMDFPGYFKDHILLDKIHKLNVSFVIEALKENFGGTAGNIAYNLALLGERPIILASAGNDFTVYQQWLQKHNVDVSQINLISDDLTAFAYIITDQDDNQISAFYPGAMRHFKGGLPEKLLSDVLAIVAPGYGQDMVEYPRIYREQGVPFLFDPGQQITSLSADSLRAGIKGAKAFISNDYELDLVMKKTGLSENEILSEAELLVTTLGDNGSQIKTKEKNYRIPPAIPRAINDPTGAGDAYRAGFIKGLIEGWPLEITGRFAGVVAVYTVEKYGTQTHHFDLEDVKQRYRENFKEELPGKE